MNRIRGFGTLATACTRSRLIRRYCQERGGDGFKPLLNYYMGWNLLGAAVGGINTLGYVTRTTLDDNNFCWSRSFAFGLALTPVGAILGAFLFATAPISFPLLMADWKHTSRRW
jgi:hypothetical protein